MPKPDPARVPRPAMFDVTTVAKTAVEGPVERVALDLAPNAPREISRDGIERLTGMLMRTGQLVASALHRAPT